VQKICDFDSNYSYLDSKNYYRICLEEKRQFVGRKMAKIAENSDQNINPLLKVHM
jgi:hypothetical protein